MVDLEAVPTLPLATSIIVEPADADDWELVELHADHMEEQILNQVSYLRHAAATAHASAFDIAEVLLLCHQQVCHGW